MLVEVQTKYLNRVRLYNNIILFLRRKSYDTLND